MRNGDRLMRRRQRLVGSNGTALKTLELLTDCYVLVQGWTVTAIGPHRGVRRVRWADDSKFLFLKKKTFGDPRIQFYFHI